MGRRSSGQKSMAGGEGAKAPDIILLVASGLAILALSVVFNEFGLLHFEWWHSYVNFHLGPGSVWAKIFDNRTLDQGVYAGRELSYLVDHIDMEAMALSVRLGFPLFISVVHVLLSVVIGVGLACFASRDLRLGSLIGLLLALLFWTTPFIYLSFLMRTAKILTALGAVWLVLAIWRASATAGESKEAKLGWRQGVGVGIGALIMSFADRQGFYFLVCALGLVGLEWALSRRRVARDICLVLLGVLLVELVYFYKIAPALTQRFWHYESDFSFNQLPWDALLKEPGVYARQSWELLLQSIAFTLGSIPRWLAAVILGVLWGNMVVQDISTRVWRRHVPGSLVFAGMMAALWVMYALMILRHPPLLWPDIQTHYYWIPTASLVILGAAWAVGYGWSGNIRAQIIIAGILSCLLVANVAALPGHRRIFTTGHLASSIEASDIMRFAFMNRGDPGFVVPQEIETLPIYACLVDYAPEQSETIKPWEKSGLGEFARRVYRSGAAVRFIWEFGGNVDLRILSTTGQILEVEAGPPVIGITHGRAEFRIGVPLNRLRGEVVLQRAPGIPTELPFEVEFALYAQPHANAEPRFERWRERVRLEAGQSLAIGRYEIDGSGLPQLLTIEIPESLGGRVIAGWRMPTITDIGRDSKAPAWLNWGARGKVPLDEAMLAGLLPAGWRPSHAWMSKGRLTKEGIELSPGGEIWLKADRLITRFSGHGVTRGGANTERVNELQGAWYKAGRLALYGPPSPIDRQSGEASFQAWGAEPGGWLAIVADPDSSKAPMIVKVTEVSEAK